MALPDKAWLLAPLQRMKKADLLALCDQLGPDARREADALTVTGIKLMLDRARRLHWDSTVTGVQAAPPTHGAAHPARAHRRSPAGRVASLCSIPAGEVNAFLRSLPRPEGMIR